MSSERKIQSARENGRKSRGPVTPEGKARSSKNATRHGLLARNLLLDRESATRFHQVVNGLHEGFHPETPSEVAAIESMAWSRWRQMRIWTLEQAAVNAEIRKLEAIPALPGHTGSGDDNGCARASQAFSTLGERSNALNLFNRYETAYDRQFSRAFRRLMAIRDARKNAAKNMKTPNEPNKSLKTNNRSLECDPNPNPA